MNRTQPGYLLPDRAIETLDQFLDTGGGEGLNRALSIGPDATLAEIAASGLRGRGGAGFSTGTKWTSVRNGGSGVRFVVANGAEGEPATFKDRTLIRLDPYRIVEGAAIAAFVVGAGTIYLATKRSYTTEVAALTRAAVEMSAAGLLQELSINIVEGPDEYLYGEEKALLEVIEGKEPLPRVLPPYQVGLFATAPSGGWEAEARALTRNAASNPTVVNNVETLASAAHIMAKGSEWFRGMGTDRSPGTVLVTVVGDVVRAGVHEVVHGTPFAEVLEMCGGPLPGRTFKAALSGVSNAVLTAEDFDVPLTFEDFAARGTGLGAAGFVVYDDTVNMAAVAYEVSRFLSVESCGQCPPCKSGSLAITGHLADLLNDVADDSVLGELEARLRSVTDANRCFLGTEEQVAVSSILRAFPADVVEFLEHRARDVRLVNIPLIKDISTDGAVTYDVDHIRKRPDWTFELAE
jgi:NADH-quinone oxidoreductase subunit F